MIIDRNVVFWKILCFLRAYHVLLNRLKPSKIQLSSALFNIEFNPYSVQYLIYFIYYLGIMRCATRVLLGSHMRSFKFFFTHTVQKLAAKNILSGGGEWSPWCPFRLRALHWLYERIDSDIEKTQQYPHNDTDSGVYLVPSSWMR